jgi:cytochrome P450
MEYANGGTGALPALNESDFDHTDPVAAQDIYRLLASGRERCPVLRSAHVPCIVIALILGLDRGDWSGFMEWVDGMEAASHVGDTATSQRYAGKLQEFLVSEAEGRKTAPRDDLLTAIATMALDGAPVSDAIRYGMAQLILVAGHDTTVAGIGSLLRHPMGIRTCAPGLVRTQPCWPARSRSRCASNPPCSVSPGR